MNTSAALVAAALTLAAATASAQEGNRDPFPFAASPQTVRGVPFVSDAASEPHPLPTGSRATPSSLATLEPVGSSEYPVQTANSMPARRNQGTAANAVAPDANRHLAARRPQPLEAGEVRPGG